MTMESVAGRVDLPVDHFLHPAELVVKGMCVWSSKIDVVVKSATGREYMDLLVLVDSYMGRRKHHTSLAEEVQDIRNRMRRHVQVLAAEGDHEIAQEVKSWEKQVSNALTERAHEREEPDETRGEAHGAPNALSVVETPADERVKALTVLDLVHEWAAGLSLTANEALSAHDLTALVRLVGAHSADDVFAVEAMLEETHRQKRPDYTEED